MEEREKIAIRKAMIEIVAAKTNPNTFVSQMVIEEAKLLTKYILTGEK